MAWVASSCNAFAIATFSSIELFHCHLFQIIRSILSIPSKLCHITNMSHSLQCLHWVNIYLSNYYSNNLQGLLGKLYGSKRVSCIFTIMMLT